MILSLLSRTMSNPVHQHQTVSNASCKLGAIGFFFFFRMMEPTSDTLIYVKDGLVSLYQ